MKKVLILAAMGAAVALLSSCAPVLSRDLMRQGERDVSLARLRETPDAYRGKVFILGGIIVNDRLTAQGSELEVLYVPVDSFGYPKTGEEMQGRYLAVYAKQKGMLDPVVYKAGREVTLAGEFRETREGKIDEMDYVYPLFEIRQVYLWEEEPLYYAYPYPYSYYDYGPYGYNPYWGPWPPPPGWW
ncbi:MAG TPA: Slp family lipoprotein [Nitrospirota bacterium]|nr:Slp family lipoprotein [Nitrospirota bacterium]